MRSIFLTSCARCGTHWVERLLWDTLDVQTCTVDWTGEGDHEGLIANVARIEGESPGGRLYVRHQPLATLAPVADRLKVIALVRDLRDVLVSVAHYYVYFQGASAPWVQVLGVKNPMDFQEVLAALLARVHNTYWFDSYLKGRGQVDHSLIRYEDLFQAPEDTMALALERLEIEHDPERLGEAVAYWTFDRLSGGRQRGQEEKGHHYRAGIVGGWREYITPGQNKAFFAQFEQYLLPFGYSLRGEV